MAASPDALSLASKVAIVTGSGRPNGIGAAIAHALARNGAAVAINYVSDHSANGADEVVASLQAAGARAIAVQADVATVAGSKKLVQETLGAFGTDQIHILVNNAGTGSGMGKLASEVPQDEAEKAFATNFFASLYTTQAVLPHMPAQGRIINIGTVVSQNRHLQGVSIYGAAKAAQDYLTAAMAFELGRAGRGITVNTIAPGPTATDAGSWFPAGEMQQEVGRTLLGMTSLGGRPGKPAEVADAVLLIVSEKASWITGQFIAASGGI